MDRREMKAVIEGLLFLWGDPLSIKDIANIIDQKSSLVNEILVEMNDEFRHEQRGIQLVRTGDSYQLATRKEHSDYYSKLIDEKKPPRLTNSSMETLTIIAYKQPITRIEVDNIRGVKSSSSIETLLSRGLIEECGRLDQIGRPIIYQTTNQFLKLFDLEDLSDLPRMEEVETLIEEATKDIEENED